VPQLEQLRHPLAVGEPARAELDVQGRVDATRHPLRFHPGFDSLYFPNGLLGDAPGGVAQLVDERGEFGA